MTSILVYLFYGAFAVPVGGFVLLWLYCRFKYSYWRKLNIKYLPPVLPFGNVARTMLVLNSFLDTFQEFYEAVGDEPYIGYYEMNIPILLVKDPELVSAILVKDFKHFQNRGRPFIFIENRKQNALSQHIGTAKGGRWKFLRQGMSPVFSSIKIKQLHDTLADTIDIVDSYLDQQMNGENYTDVELKDLFERLTMHVITASFFGSKCTSITSSKEFQQMMNETFQPKLKKTWHRLLAAYCPTWLNDILNRPEVDYKVLDYFRRLVLDSVEYRKLKGVRGNDILQSMMDLQNSHTDPKFAVGDDNKRQLPHERFDENDIMANIFILLFGGFESTSATLSFCVYELALNENIQQNVRLEVQKVKDECGVLNYESLNKMNYLEAVIAETLRIYPVSVAASRECTEDYIIPGTEICLPKGTHIKIPTWSLHHDSRYFPNPENFDPQRFIGNNKHSILKGTYLPFGDGPRSCVGKRFSEVEMKAALADLILKYDIKPCARTETPIKFKNGSIIQLSKNGVWVNMIRRKT